MKRDYIEVVYNELDRPLTDYPEQLARHLVNRYQLNKGLKLLDLGCGRGEFLKGFINCGMTGFGVDRSLAAAKLCPSADIRTSDFEKPLPFDDNYFDVVFSKSVLEHAYDPEKLVLEIYRVLKPGGRVITMCPAWEYNYRIYYEDYTHRSPFMRPSLHDIHKICGFDDVECDFFRQLPAIWKYPSLVILTELVRLVSPAFMKRHSKFVRFSKEIMLLASALKSG